MQNEYLHGLCCIDTECELDKTCNLIALHYIKKRLGKIYFVAFRDKYFNAFVFSEYEDALLQC